MLDRSPVSHTQTDRQTNTFICNLEFVFGLWEETGAPAGNPNSLSNRITKLFMDYEAFYGESHKTPWK